MPNIQSKDSKQSQKSTNVAPIHSDEQTRQICLAAVAQNRVALVFTSHALRNA
jgi:hypothetical protein